VARPDPEVRSASLARSADFHFDRKPSVHESHDKDHKQILLSAPLGIARDITPGFPFEAQPLLHLELARSRLTESFVLLVLG
jgi:hypothetical protein